MRRIWLAVMLGSLTSCTLGDIEKKFEPRSIDEAAGSAMLVAELGVPDPHFNTSATYYGLRKLSAEDPGNTTLAANLALAGMDQVDALCDEWFTRLSLAQSKLRATDDVVTLGGTALAGILALTHAGLAATGVTAVATGAAHSLLATTQANFIVAPDIATVAQARADSDHFAL